MQKAGLQEMHQGLSVLPGSLPRVRDKGQDGSWRDKEGQGRDLLIRRSGAQLREKRAVRLESKVVEKSL
jgi:hypothetical protein